MSKHPLPQPPPTEPADLVETLWAPPAKGPDLNVLLADHPQWSAREVRDALLIDQQFRWRTGDPWITEDYLTLAPSLAADDDLTLDLIYGECRGRTQQGNPPDLAELVQRFPHLRDRLDRQMEIASWFADADGGPAPTVDEEDSTSEAEGTAIRFGDYDLCEEIARGGMGVIYRAQDRKLKRIVALKMIRPERLLRATDVRRFKNETRIIARLEHPNIIPILNVGQVDGVHFFTMRMVRGRDLESRRTEYLDDVRRAARLVSAVAAAIHHAHQHGVLHRDLKPSNVLVDDSGVPYVVDFGLARHVSEASDLTGADEFLGTPAYAAPEQLREDSDPLTVAADVYGLGAILYVLITGQPPFSGRNSEPASPRLLLRGSNYDRLQALAFSVDSQTLAACDKNGSIHLCPVPAAGESLVDGPPARVWQAHEGRASSVAFHPTKNQVASTGQDSHVAIWDLGARVEPRTLDEPAGPDAHERTLAFTPDSRHLAVPG